MRLLLLLCCCIIAADLVLLVSGYRLLISEKRVDPGQFYIVEDYGNLGSNSQASLACSYFSGRSIKTAVFWYSSNNLFGRDSCPFLYRP